MAWSDGDLRAGARLPQQYDNNGNFSGNSTGMFNPVGTVPYVPPPPQYQATSYVSSGPVRSNSSGRYSAPAPPPPANPGPIKPITPSIDTFLNQDTGYQDQMNQFGNALTQFLADVQRRRGVLTSDYGSSTKAMADQKVLDLRNMEADYGARGLLTSGLYGRAQGDYNNEYNTRFSDLGNKQTQAMDSLNQEQGRFTSQQDLQKQQAKEQAIRRRAEQYGV